MMKLLPVTVLSVSNRSKSTVSSTASAHICAEAEKAALEAKLTALTEGHALEEEEEELNKQMKQLRKQKETLILKSELEATAARITVFNSVESQSKTAHLNAMNEYYGTMSGKYKVYAMETLKNPTQKESAQSSATDTQTVRSKEGPNVRYSLDHPAQAESREPQRSVQKEHSARHDTQPYPGSVPISRNPMQAQSYESQPNPSTQVNPRQDALYNVLQSQNDITANLVKQQPLSTAKGH